MYLIISMSSGEVLDMVDKPRYIKRGNYGSFVETTEEEANGLSYEGKVYNLKGRNKIGGIDTVFVKEVPLSKLFAQQAEAATEAVAAVQTRANLMFVVAAREGTIDNTTIIENAELFQEVWEPDKDYVDGDFRLDEGVLYKCIQAHHSQVGWNPSAVPALWVYIGDPNEEYPAWRQARFKEEAYRINAKCSHNGKKWYNTIDYNVWEPGTPNSGWVEVVEGESENIQEESVVEE